MSAKMKRRARHDRRKRVLTHRREIGVFFAGGAFPSSARACAMCPCGARAFTTDGDDRFFDDFDDAHRYCDEVSS